jgi:SAM-dependent methyltransferase
VNSYTGLHARLYDAFYADKPYAEEARFVHELAGVGGGRLLDVACGTGRHARAFADLGYDPTATDLNEELLEVGRAASNGRVRFVQADMTDLDVGGGPYDLVTCLFDSIGYALESERVVAALRSLDKHVAPGGALVVEFLHAPAIARSADPRRQRTVSLPDGRVATRTSEMTLDVERMHMHVRYEVALDGERHEEEQVNRVFTVPEMRLLAEAAGLAVRSLVPAFTDGPIERDTFHVLLVAGAAA